MGMTKVRALALILYPLNLDRHLVIFPVDATCVPMNYDGDPYKDFIRDNVCFSKQLVIAAVAKPLFRKFVTYSMTVSLQACAVWQVFSKFYRLSVLLTLRPS